MRSRRAYINPDVFPIILSVYLVAALAVGGLDSLVGPDRRRGADLLPAEPRRRRHRWLNHLPALDLDPKRPGMPSVIFGAVLIVVMILLPTGVGGLLRRFFGPLTTRLYSKS